LFYHEQINKHHIISCHIVLDLCLEASWRRESAPSSTEPEPTTPNCTHCCCCWRKSWRCLSWRCYDDRLQATTPKKDDAEQVFKQNSQ